MQKPAREKSHDAGTPEEHGLPPYSLYADGVDGGLAIDTADVQADGRIDVDLDSSFARTLAQIIEAQQEDIHNPPPEYFEERPKQSEPVNCNIKLNVVIQIVGSRGDVQPFIALGNELQKVGHRVRIATHDVFRTFVTQSGLEFYPIGGDPAELMAFMVKNPGLIPKMKSLRAGEVQKKRAMVAEMLDGCWRSCIEDDPVTQVPFVADAIIANPPSFAHIHCAQALSIPVHLMFTMPWSSTMAFPHPLANLRASDMNPTTANWVSYGVVEWLTWQGLGDVINRWRAGIDLEPIPLSEGPSLAETLKIPFTYCWSPALVPKPRDWPSHIDICGFFFRNTPSYKPPRELLDFLQSGPAPIYIGFGSIVVDNPQKLTKTILDAVAGADVRAIISRGWSKLGGDPNQNIFYIDDCPHEWLFQHVAAVVHHGGAGTTACGLAHGRPTAIVPFFGDQPFWGNMVARAGAGARPIPYSRLNSQDLADAISFCLTPQAAAAAQQISAKMRTESGVTAAVQSFHRHLPLERMRCRVMPNQAAAWTIIKSKQKIHLCKPVAQILIEKSLINAKDIRSHEVNPIFIENRRWDPLTGLLSASTSTGYDMLKSSGGMLYKPYMEYKRSRSPRPSSNSANRNNPRASSSTASIDHSSTSESNTQYPADGRIVKETLPGSLATAGNIAGVTLKEFGKFTSSYFKGVVVDIPHATAEGFRQVPRLYGEQPKDYGTVKDWRTGAVMGGRNFVDGMADGFTGLFTQPIKGAKEEGVLGAVKGLAKGTIGLATRVPSAGIGLVAYPFHGIAKTIEGLAKSKTKKAIVNARLRDGLYIAERIQLTPEEEAAILQRFQALAQSVDG
ncbi:putative sterol glucosyltransferase [Aspergillus homomorphus CBS 101889]|uniref:Sterol glucosyltransferase n=1 Tax=Aspergillus homomorphus (strain CBS 101889) TaxID=1450537 RepID=A0A395I6H8_ASPHC|nr:sterol glucosyltransferase [Aspergillus homomorphus CBS 101889]RAL15750.1 sterol glucosyltransferase [Aspergillus homomorphus CBS 101889]